MGGAEQHKSTEGGPEWTAMAPLSEARANSVLDREKEGVVGVGFNVARRQSSGVSAKRAQIPGRGQSGAAVECNDKYESGGNGCEGEGNLGAGNEKDKGRGRETGVRGDRQRSSQELTSGKSGRPRWGVLHLAVGEIGE